MKWYLIIIKSFKYVESVEAVLKYAGIRYKMTGLTRYMIYTTEEEAVHLNNTFECAEIMKVKVV
jgi:hypothetical protein